jgi:hypothetical protein
VARRAVRPLPRFAAVLLCCLAWCGWAGAVEPPRFLIFHVDAVAAVDLDRLIAEGRLPNVARAFEGGSAHDAVSLFYAATPVIYPRMHDRAELSVLGGIGFGGYDRETETVVGDLAGFLSLVAAVPRRAATCFLYGVPYLDGLAGLAMQNLPDLLERYRVVEFFWFSSDAMGHLYGAEAHAASLERFDAHLGRLLPRLDLDGLNLILYTDHGLTFTDQTVDVGAILERSVGDGLIYFKYPNVYLQDPSVAPALASSLTRFGDLDFAFYRLEDGAVEGYVYGAFVRFEADGDGIRYRAERCDPFGYDMLGYAGEALTPDAWLALTIGERYPAAPPNVFQYLQNRDVGDLVVGLNPPRIPLGVLTQGGHSGLVDTDLVVKVLARGPQVEPLREGGVAWLPDLFRDLPDIPFGFRPERERHQVELRYRLDDLAPSLRLSLSPAYRTRWTLDVAPSRWALWSEHDVFASYLTRWWFGVGVGDSASEAVQPLARLALQVDVGDVQLGLEAFVRPAGWAVRLGVGVRLEAGWRLTWEAPAGVGVGWAW